MAKLTLEDIKKAICSIKEHHKEEEIYEDEYQKIYGECGIPTKIELKKKGVYILNELIKDNMQKINGDKRIGRITTLYGVPVVVDGKDD